jgi:hypothetical protein
MVLSTSLLEFEIQTESVTSDSHGMPITIQIFCSYTTSNEMAKILFHLSLQNLVAYISIAKFAIVTEYHSILLIFLPQFNATFACSTRFHIRCIRYRVAKKNLTSMSSTCAPYNCFNMKCIDRQIKYLGQASNIETII